MRFRYASNFACYYKKQYICKSNILDANFKINGSSNEFIATGKTGKDIFDEGKKQPLTSLSQN